WRPATAPRCAARPPVRVPDVRAAPCNLVHRAPALDRRVDVGGDVVAASRRVVAMLDQQPLRFRAAVRAYECKGAAETRTLDGDAAPPLLEPATNARLALGPIGLVREVRAAVPQHARAAAVLVLGDGALERVVGDRMILDLHRKSLHRGVAARSLWHRPALHDAVELEAQVEMQTRCRVLLDHEPEVSTRTRRTLRGCLRCRIARLRCYGKVALAAILRELPARTGVRRLRTFRRGTRSPRSLLRSFSACRHGASRPPRVARSAHAVLLHARPDPILPRRSRRANISLNTFPWRDA